MFERIMDEPRQEWVLEKHMHWTRRVGLLWPCLLLLLSAAVGSAQDGPIHSETSGVVALDDFSGSMSLSADGGTYLLFHKMIGDGVGYDTGYSRIGLRAKIWEDYDRHIFGEIHTLITDSSRVGFNVGGGYRKLYDEGIWGIHGWYDNYQSRSNNRYQQISLGSEYLHPVFDIRTNVYVPVGEDENFLSIVDFGSDPLFMDHTIGTMGIGQFERAYQGADLEGGIPFPHLNWLRMYAGTYFLNADDNDVWGARGRVEARVSEGVMLNFLASNDDTFGTNVNMEVEVRFDGRSPTRWDCNFCNLSRRYDQVRRNWSIQTHRDLDDIFIPLKNPRTGEDYDIVWVNNQAPAGGDGSFENPFTSLPAVADGSDLVLVRRGVGGTTGRITLQPYQQILGEGKAHQINTDRLGLITLPETFRRTGAMPTLVGNGTAAPVITLANNSVVRGFNFNAQNAIFGQNLTNFMLECLRGNVTNGINIQNGGGNGFIRDVEFDVAPGGTGILVTNTSGDPLNLTMGNIATRGGVFGTRIVAGGADVNYSIRDLSAALATNAGLSLEAVNADLTGTATNVVTSGMTGTGVNIDLSNATGQSVFNNLRANNNGVDGLHAIADDGTVYSLSILDSILSGNVDDNLDTDAVDGSTLNLLVDPTSLVQAGDNGWEFMVAGQSTLNARFLEVTMSSNGADAINGNVFNGSVARLDFDNVNARRSGDDGLDLFVAGQSDVFADFRNVQLDRSGDIGMRIEAIQGSDVDFVLNDVTLNNNGAQGLVFDLRGGAGGRSRLDLTAYNVNLSDNSLNHIRGNAEQGSIANLLFNTVTADRRATDGGVVFRARTAGKIFSTWTNGSISNTRSDGVRVDAMGNATQVGLTFNNVDINENLFDGIDMTLVNGGSQSRLDLTLRNSSVARNGMAGIGGTESSSGIRYILNGNDAQGQVVIRNTPITGNREDGFHFEVTGGADLVANATGVGLTSFDNNLSNAFDGFVDGVGSRAIVTVAEATGDNSGHAGAYFITDHSGRLIFNYTNGSLSNSGRDGLFVVSQNGSRADINLANVNLNDNGQSGIGSGDGLSAFADSGSMINLDLQFVTADDNNETGFAFRAQGASTINVSPAGGFLRGRNNQREGLLFDVREGSIVRINALDGSFSNNGQSGAFSGVRGNVTGTNSRATVSFDSTIVDNNTQDGFEFTVNNGGRLIAELLNSGALGSTLSASNNAGAGISLTAVGPGSSAALVMEGGGDFTNNGEDGLVATANGVNQFAVQAHGNFDSNGADGIRISSVDVGATAIEIAGPSSSSDNMGDGVTINLDNTSLADIPVTTLTQTEVVQGFHLDGITVSSNGGAGIEVTGNDLAVDRFEISNTSIDDHGGDGLVLTFTNSDFNEVVLDGNDIFDNGNIGVNASFTDGMIGTFALTNNVIGENGLHGFVLNLDNNPIGTLNVADNVIGVSGGQTTSPMPIDDSLPVIRPGFDLNTLPSNDDGSTTAVALGFTANFFGQFFNDLFVNNNGNVTFNAPLGTFTPFGLLNTAESIIAPFFADVDTRDPGGVATNDVTYGQGTVNGRPAFGVNWLDVRHFSVNGTNQGLPTNSFQLVLVDRSDVAVGDFDIEFNYGSVLWESGEASGGDAFGLGGSSATIGFSNGVDTAFELPGSGINGSFLDGGPAATSLVQNSLNSVNNGRYIFFARSGDIGSGGGGTIGNGQNGIGDGIQINAINGSDIGTMTMDRNVVEGNTGRGIAIDLDDSSLGGGTIADNEILANGSHGLEITADNTSVTDLSITGNQINENGGDGILFDFNNTPVTNLNISDNPDINDNGGNGINFQMVNSNINGLTIDNNGMGVIVPPPTNAFDITVNIAGGLTPSQQLIFAQAAQRWQDIIVGDLPDVGPIDDVLIQASGVAIDGAGGILGQAGPTGLRGGTFLPFQGIMQFDTADLAALEGSGQLLDVILHEMAHVLGSGTIWDDLGLLSGAGTADPRFNGTAATAEYNTRFGTNDTGVPVENTGGPGTRDSHWRETVFTNELMTGFLNAGVNPISLVTIAQFEDIGYQVDLTQADPFLLNVVGPSSGDPGDVIRPISTVLNDPSQLGSVTGLASLRRNGANGINISLTNSNLTGGVISRNLITDHDGGDGIRIVNATTQGAPIELDFDRNMILDNTGGRGINIALAGNTTMNSNFTGNEVSRNGFDAISVELRDNAGMNFGDFSRNAIDGNGGMGLRIDAEDNTNVVLNTGASSAPADLNVISNNVDAGIGINLRNSAAADISITNTNVSGTTNGPNPTFAGDGLHVRATDDVVISRLQIGHPTERNTSFNGNEGDGIRVRADLNAAVNNFSITNVTANLNGGDGLNVFRGGNASVGTVPITDSEFNQNGGDGIDITASLANTTDTYNILDNVVTGNTGRGLALRAEFDADIVATIDGNQIGGNGGDGIELSEFSVNVLDTPSITADITDNDVSNNGGNGIDVLARHDLLISGNTIDGNEVDGINLGADAVNPADPTLIVFNSISGNGQHGIDVGSPNMTLTIGTNLIDDNGGSGVNNPFGASSTIAGNSITGNAVHGVSLIGGTHTVDNNAIESNGRDGIQAISENGRDLTLSAEGNSIRSNNGRGIDLLVRGTTLAQATFLNNLIEGNLEEGVYVVTTASTTQSADTLATDVLAADGDVFANPQLLFDFRGNAVQLNGVNSGFDGSGFVMRVGTSGSSTAPRPYEDDGGFASTGGGFGLANMTGRSGVLARVQNNTFANNPGADVLFESFVSTVDPSFGFGLWDAVVYDPSLNGVQPYQQDPLARLDMFFSGNSGDQLDVTRQGAFYDNVSNQFFKNRHIGEVPSGPFTQGFIQAQNRRRNAQRQAFRGVNAFGDFSDPGISTVGTGGNSDDFRFPGVGTSTFRISAGSSAAGFTGGDIFATQEPIPGALFGELPFGWGSF